MLTASALDTEGKAVSEGRAVHRTCGEASRALIGLDQHWLGSVTSQEAQLVGSCWHPVVPV